MMVRAGAKRFGASVVMSALVAGGTVATSVPAMAQQGRDAETAQAATRTFNIPPQPLASALPLFGQQSGRQITADAATVRGASTSGVQGTMTVEEAMRQLLAGTGMTYSVGAGSVISVQRIGPTTSSALQLDPVQVQGNSVPPQAEIGNLMPAYAGGEVARGGRVGVLGNRDYMDTPFSTTTYTEKYIEDNQARTLMDVFADDPSIRPLYGQSQYDDRIFIRGFQANMGDLSFNGLYGVSSPYSMPMAGIERVEVLRGPSAMLGGMAPRGAVGGTINFVPKRAPDEGVTRATATYATNSQFGGHLDVGRRFGPDNALGLRVNAFYSGGDTPVARQSDSLLNLTAGFDFRSPQTRIDADFGYINRRIVGSQIGTTLRAGLLLPPAPTANGNYYQPWEFYTYDTAYGSMRFEHDLRDNLTAYFKSGGNRSNGAFLMGTPTIVDTSGATTSTPFKTVNYSENISLEAGLRGKFDTGPVKHEAVITGSYLINWTGGISQAVPAVASNIYAPIIQPSPNLTGFAQGAPQTSRSLLTSIGLIDAISAMDNKLQVIGGVRLQQIQVANWNALTAQPAPGYAQSAVTPTVSVIVKPWRYLSFYGNFIQALEQGPIAGPALANANAVFPPFISTQFEAGAKLDLQDFGATLSLFRITRPSSYVNAATNSLVVNGQQVNSGIEFTMFGEPVKGLRPLGGFTVLNPVLTSTLNGINNGHYAPGVPTFQANLGVDWDTPYLKGVTVGGRVIYTGQTFIDPANLQPVPAWTRFDLNAKYVFERPDGKPVALRAQVLNVANNNYWMSAGGYLTQGMPRTFMLSLTADF